MSAGGSTLPRYLINSGSSFLPENAANGSQRDICTPRAMAAIVTRVWVTVSVTVYPSLSRKSAK